LTLTKAYTWAHRIDTGSGLRVNSNPFNASYGRGNCDMDVRHCYMGTVIYALPFFRDQGGFAGHVLGGFNFATVITLQTGVPFDIVDGGDRSPTVGGSVFHGPGVLNSDVSLWKSVNNTERQSLVLRADAFNFFIRSSTTQAMRRVRIA
jgi:hypothetical protein